MHQNILLNFIPIYLHHYHNTTSILHFNNHKAYRSTSNEILQLTKNYFWNAQYKVLCPTKVCNIISPYQTPTREK